MKYSNELINFVSSLIYGYDLEPIDILTAAYDIRNWKAENIELPHDMTAYNYMKLWNELIENEVAQ